MIPPPPRPEAHWKRPFWHASEEQARLLYFVFGQFGNALAADLPEGIELTRHPHAALKDWEGYPLTGSLREVFAGEAPDTLRAARKTPEVLRISGTLHDPANLDYLRETLETITRLFDAGAVAVVDPQVSGLYDRTTWNRRVASGSDTTLRQHFLVLRDADPDDPICHWVHTRGLRKFARPDISITRVPGTETDRAGALCQQMADMLALGGHFAEGQTLPVDGIGMFRAHLGGTPDDPRFFNTHVELRWPA